MRSTRLLGAASARMASLAILAVLAGCTGQDADSAKSKPPASSKASPLPTASPRAPLTAPPETPAAKPNFVLTTCKVESLSMRLGKFTQGATETSVNLYLKPARGAACTLSGFGSLALFADDGSEVKTVIVEEAKPAPTTITLKPGTEAVKRLRWSTKPAADEPQTGACGALAVILSVRLTEPSVSVDLYTKSSRPEGIGAVCNHGRLMHTAWQPA